MINKLVAKNILSFNDLIQVNFEPTSIIFGKNASGKTNLLFLINFIKNLIIGNVIDPASFAKNYEYRFKEERSDIILGLSFEHNNNKYEILIVLNAKKGFVSQKLTHIKRTKKGTEKLCLFDSANNYFPQLNETEVSRLSTYVWKNMSIIEKLNNEFDLSDKLFAKHISNVYEFFSKCIHIEFNDHSSAELLYGNHDLINKIVKVINALGIPITNIKIVKKRFQVPNFGPFVNSSDANLRNSKTYQTFYTMELQHKNLYYLDESMESTGTMRIINIMAMLLDEKYSGHVWLFDEFETSLHEEIYSVFPLFVLNKSKGQTLMASHNTYLLEKKCLAKKNFIIVNKTIDEYSEVYSLADFSELRSDIRNNWLRWYRQNRFGGYPELDIERILNDEKEEC